MLQFTSVVNCMAMKGISKIVDARTKININIVFMDSFANGFDPSYNNKHLLKILVTLRIVAKEFSY